VNAGYILSGVVFSKQGWLYNKLRKAPELNKKTIIDSLLRQTAWLSNFGHYYAGVNDR